MSLFTGMQYVYPTPGFGNVPDYQVPGIPWVTSSVITGTVSYEFPLVTRSITVANLGGGDLRVAFTENGLNTNYFTLQAGQSLSEELRITKIFLNGNASSITVIAGLTGILFSAAPVLSASNGFKGVG